MKKLIACFALGVFASLSLTASSVSVARQQMADRNFVGMKETLDTLLQTQPQNNDARFLRTIASAALYLQDDTTDFMESLGALVAEVDLAQESLELDFDMTALTGKQAGRSWILSSAGASLAPAGAPTVNFENTSAQPISFELVIEGPAQGAGAIRELPFFDFMFYTADENISYSLTTADAMRYDGEGMWTESHSPLTIDSVSWDNENYKASIAVTLAANHSVSLSALSLSMPGMNLTLPSSIPSGLVVVPSGASWASSNSIQFGGRYGVAAVLGFSNEGTTPFQIQFDIDLALSEELRDELGSVGVDFFYNGQMLGYIWASSGWDEFDFNAGSNEWINPQLIWTPRDDVEATAGGNLSLWLYPGDYLVLQADFITIGNLTTIADALAVSWNTLPAGAQLHNGIVPVESVQYPAFRNNTRLANIGNFMTTTADGVLQSIINDLSAIGGGFHLSLTPAETGLAEPIVFTFTDTQLLIAALNMARASQLLVRHRNLELDLTAQALDPFGLSLREMLNAHPALFNPLGSQTQAVLDLSRGLVEQAIDLYESVEGNLWQRGEPVSGSYFFQVDQDAESDRQEAEAWMQHLRESLRDSVNIARLPGQGGAAQRQDEAVTLAPLFEGSGLDFRRLLGKVASWQVFTETFPWYWQDRLLAAHFDTWLNQQGIITQATGGPWYENASFLADGWRYFSWFKGFKPGPGDWIFHGRHGWLFVQAESTQGMFLWDVAMRRWFWTNDTVYPWMYAYGPNEGWVFFFEGGRPGSRWFQRGDTGAMVFERQLRAP